MPSNRTTSAVPCTCLFCGTTFSVKPSKIKNERGKYCSRSCAAKHRTGDRNGKWIGGPPNHICLNCGKTFRLFIAKTRPNDGKYCSHRCAAVAKSQIVGAASPRWKGGRCISTSGYIVIPQKEGSHVLEHRQVMEQHLGRKLRSYEHIHHINGNKQDNRIENLQILSPSEHSRLHSTGRSIGRWAKLFDQCAICGTTEQRHWAKGFCYKCYVKNRH